MTTTIQETDQQKHQSVFHQILDVVVARTGVDFYHYKHTTLQRRIIRRMHLLNIQNGQRYLEYLQSSEREQHHLYKEMLIHVSSFFRDESSFDYLCAHIIPNIAAQKDNDVIRVWVCGCATGEEAYSIAICLHEYLSSIGDEATRIKIFASDLSEQAIARARRAVYSHSTLMRISDERLQRYFSPHPSGRQVKTFIRDMCVFAVHNVLSHPPFANIDLLSCRNVLIYMQSVLQKKVLSTFSYALKENGFLFLGKSETSGQAGKFEPVNKSANIFVNRERNSKLFSIGKQPSEQNVQDMDKQERISNYDKKDFQRAADDLLLSRYVPAGVVVNDAFEIVDFRGHTGFFIEPSPGIASLSVLKMVRKGLYYDLQEALNKSKTERVAVRKDGVALEHEGTLLRIDLEVMPLPATRDKYYLVLFHNVTITPAEGLNSNDGINNTKDLRIHQLEQELMQSREQLRALSEEQEAINEEFQSANEELKTLNEELQTSQEELVSINDELTVRNKELNQLNRELVQAHNYANSINNTVNDSLVVLDKYLRVKSANMSFYERFHLEAEHTEGIAIYELANGQWNIPEFRRLLEEVLPRHIETTGFEMSGAFEGLGYRTLKLNIRQIRNDGESESLILLAIEDITERKQTQEDLLSRQHELEISNQRLTFAMNTGRIGSWELNPETGSLVSSEQFRRNFGLPDTADLSFEDLKQLVFADDRDALLEALDTAIKEHKMFSREYRVSRGDGSLQWIEMNGLAVYDDRSRQARKMIGVTMDITERKTEEDKLQYSEQHFRTLANSAPVMITMSGPDGLFNFYNKQWTDFSELDEPQKQGWNWEEDIHPEDIELYRNAHREALSKHARFNAEFRLRHKGEYRKLFCTAVPRFTVDNRFDGYTMACMDVNEQQEKGPASK